MEVNILQKFWVIIFIPVWEGNLDVGEDNNGNKKYYYLNKYRKRSQYDVETYQVDNLEEAKKYLSRKEALKEKELYQNIINKKKEMEFKGEGEMVLKVVKVTLSSEKKFDNKRKTTRFDLMDID